MKGFSYTFYFILGILLIMRFVYLDQDAPSYFISGVCQEDEAYYSNGALSFIYSDHDPEIEMEHGNKLYSLGIFRNAISLISFKLFGLNYWGLRLPAVMFSIVIILLFLDIGRKLKIPTWTNWLLMLVISTDYYYLLFSRFQTPQIYSLFILTLIIWFFLTKGVEDKAKLLLLGCLSLSSVIMIYLFNLFAFISISIFVLIISVRRRSWTPVIFYTLGSMISVFVFIILIYASGSSIQEMYHTLAFSGNMEKIESGMTASSFLASLPSKFIGSISQILNTNFFRFNLSELWLYLMCLPQLLYSCIYKKDNVALFLLLFIPFIFLQNIFINSYPFKKLIVLYPIIIVSILYCFSQLKHDVFSFLKTKMPWVVTWGLVCFGICLYNFKVNKSYMYWSGFDYGYYSNTDIVFDVLNICINIFIVFFMIYIIRGENKVYKFRYLFFLLIVPQVYLSVKTIGFEKRFDLRDTLISLRSDFENAVIVSGWGHAYQFYNEAKPILNHYAFRNNETKSKELERKFFDELESHKRFKMVKFFHHEENYKNLKKGDIFEETANYKLEVFDIKELTFYNILILSCVDVK